MSLNAMLAGIELNLQSADEYTQKKDLFTITRWSLLNPNTEIQLNWKGQTATAKFINKSNIKMNGVSYKSCHDWARNVKQDWINARLVVDTRWSDCNTFKEVHYKDQTGVFKPLRSIQEKKQSEVAALMLSK